MKGESRDFHGFQRLAAAPWVAAPAASADLRPLLVAMAAMAVVGLPIALLVTRRSDRR